MKAFLLAAGYGTRLRPLTDKTPKCLLPVHGKPMLKIWLQHLAKCGVDEVLVNTHYLHEQIEQFAKNWSPPPKLILSYEPSLLGSAGTLHANRNFIQGEDFFLVCYADNLTIFDLSLLVKMLQSPQTQKPLGVMALHRTTEPWRCGIAKIDKGGWIQKFEEKPAHPDSNLANAGLYVFTHEAIKLLPQETPSDIARHFIPKLVSRLLGLEMKVPLIDIGTLETYQHVNNTPSMF